MKLTALATVIGLVPLVAGCSERAPRAAASSDSTTPAAPLKSTAGAPPAVIESTAAAQPERPLISWMRSSFGPTARQVTVFDERPAGYHGTDRIIVIRSLSTNSTAMQFHVYVVNEAMDHVVRSVESWTAPWPDFTVRLDSVTPDSVYVTGRSTGYRRTLSRAYQWWPTGWKQPNLGRPQVAMAAPVCDDSLRVDLDARTIAGIWMNQPLEAVKREVGAANVIEGTTEAEGETSKMYTIKLCGHEVRRSWNGVSWHDPVFRTPEGLGIGSPLAAFDTAYGKGEATGEEGNSVRYWPLNGVGHFFVDVPDGCHDLAGGHWVVGRSCRATRISFIVFEKP